MLNNLLNNLNISEIFTDFAKNWILFFKKLKILDIRSMFVKFRQNFIKILSIWRKNALSIWKMRIFEWVILNNYSKPPKLWSVFFWNFAIWAVQRICKSFRSPKNPAEWVFGCYHGCPYSRERASQSLRWFIQLLSRLLSHCITEWPCS